MEKLKDRYLIIGFIFLLIVMILIYQIVNLQLVNGQSYDQQSQKKLINNRSIVAPRGKITDRNGVPIAVNRMGFSVQIVKTGIDTATFNQMLLDLTKVFEKNGVSYYKSLSKYLTIDPVSFGPNIQNSEASIKTWLSQIVAASKDAGTLHTAQDAFNYLRTKRFNIDKKYTDQEAYDIMTLRFELYERGYSMLNPVVIASDVNQKTIAELEEKHSQFPGVTTDVVPVRNYVDSKDIANVLGYVGAISTENYKKLKGNGYDLNDIIGIDGIEKQAENYLKGIDGEKTIEVDTSGRQTEEIKQKAAIPGDDIQLTLDMKLQQIAANSLKKTIDAIRNKQPIGNNITDIKNNMGDAYAGAVVAMDVTNGEILAMATYPSYDPSIFLEPANNKEAQKAITAYNTDNIGRPMFNRAISGKYAPGSTFKPVVGISGLEEGAITPTETINDTGVVYYDKMKFTCLEGGHGPIALTKALATSCNIYFYELGNRVGIDKVNKWAKMFGLDQLTGIDLPGENKGTVSGRDTKKKINPYPWGAADTAQSSIGQLYNSFTPIELVDYISTIANGGKRFTPHLIKQVTKYDGSVESNTKPTYQQLPIKQQNLMAVQDGMVAVTNSEDGTAVSVFKDFPFKVAGKTGTAETGDTTHSNNGVFVCYAPANKPKIAIAVVIERGVFGYFSAPIAKDIMQEYFKLNSNNTLSDTVASDEIMFTH
ncbi:MAG: penicillin-binding protein 2 [Bacillota bacterium]|nr:penicillin-binding protein 2 [Bacillota bacterium]